MLYYQRRKTTDPFTDLLFNALLGFTFLFFIAIMFMNPIPKSGIVNPKAEYIITIGWPDGSSEDIDVWVENPKGELVWFRNQESGLLHLDRDDRGALNDTITISGKQIINPLNQEIVPLRGVITGEYVVNIHYYATGVKDFVGQPTNSDSVKVDVKVEKVNPQLEVVYYGVTTLSKVGDEKTAVRFKISKDGRVREINKLPKQLVQFDKLGGGLEH